MRRRRRRRLAALLPLLLALPFASEATAQESAVAAMGTAFRPVEAGGMRIEDGSAWTRPAGASAGIGIVTIHNRGATADRIVSISSPSSRETRLYRKTPDGKAVRVEDLEIPAGATVAMRPDDLFIDFRNVTQPFRVGGEVAVTLTFGKAGAVGLRLPVLATP